MSLATIIKLKALEAFTSLQHAASSLYYYVCERDSQLPVYLQVPRNMQAVVNGDWRSQVFTLLNQFSYLPEQAPREIIVAVGLVAASEHTLQALQYLNIAKLNFQRALNDLKAHKIDLKTSGLIAELEEIQYKRVLPLANPLRQLGLARLHLKQCYRQVHLLPQKPVQVAWTWANTRSIKRITVSDALELLRQRYARKNSFALQKQIAKLQSLTNDYPLAMVQQLAPNLRANIWFYAEEQIERRMIKATMPIFYLASDADLPKLRPPKRMAPPNSRQRRSDLKIELEPFLPDIRVHRYLNYIT